MSVCPFPSRLIVAVTLSLAAPPTLAEPVAVPPTLETEPTKGNAPVSAAAVQWDGGRALLVNDEVNGIDIHDFDGERRARLGRAGLIDLDARSGLDWSGGRSVVIASIDEPGERPAIFTAVDGVFSEADVKGFDSLEFLPDALCLHHDESESTLYLFLLDGAGMVQQWLLHPGYRSVEALAVRNLPVGGETKGCHVDDARGRLYVAEEEMAVWEWDAHPERAAVRRPLDLAAPWGRLDSPTDITIDPDLSQIVIADEGSESLHLYAADSGLPLGEIHVATAGEIDGVEAPEMVSWVPAAERDAVFATFAGGGLVVTDEDNNDGAGNYKLITADAIASVTRRAAADEGESNGTVIVRPAGATDPVATNGDAADDPAIWVHPTDPAKSLILGTDKKAGLAVYGLDGRQRQFFADGRLNNVDLRHGFVIDGREMALVAASNRSTKTIAFYAIDPQSAKVSRLPVTEPVATGFEEPYGLCSYRDAESGEQYVFVNDKEGRVRQWHVTGAVGGVAAERVREWSVGSKTEGCVADDEHGHLFIGEEDVALWRYGAAPDAGEARVAVDFTRAHGGRHLMADIEGVALASDSEGRGYLVASSQGDDSYVVYRREGDHAYVGRFRIAMHPQIGLDGASETDGIEVTSSNLGPLYAGGLLVVQDGRNLMPSERQNFKLVLWESVLDALGE